MENPNCMNDVLQILYEHLGRLIGEHITFGLQPSLDRTSSICNVAMTLHKIHGGDKD